MNPNQDNPMDPNPLNIPEPQTFQPEQPIQQFPPIVEPQLQPQSSANNFQDVVPLEQAMPTQTQPAVKSSSGFDQLQPIMVSSQPDTQNKLMDKKKIKLFIVFATLAAIFIGIVITVWVMFFNKTELTQYSNNDYSVMVPKSYTKDEVGSSVTFKKPNQDSTTQSQVTINVSDIPSSYKNEYIKQIDTEMTKESFSAALSSNQEITDFKVDKSKKDELDVRVASCIVKKNNQTTEIMTWAILVSSKKAYTITIEAHVSEPSLSNSASTIIGSFKAK